MGPISLCRMRLSKQPPDFVGGHPCPRQSIRDAFGALLLLLFGHFPVSLSHRWSSRRLEFMEEMHAAFQLAAAFDSVEDLMDNALAGRPAKCFVEFCRACRMRRQSRRSFAEVEAKWKHGSSCQWLKRLLPSIWAAYRALLPIANPQKSWLMLPSSQPSLEQESAQNVRGRGDGCAPT